MTISMMLLMLRQLGRTINNIQILILDFHGAKPSAAAPIFVFIIIIIIVPLVLTALKYSDFLAIYIYIQRVQSAKIIIIVSLLCLFFELIRSFSTTKYSTFHASSSVIYVVMIFVSA